MASVDYFLKIDGIEGESQDSKHKNEIELMSWSWGQAQMGTGVAGGGSGAGKVAMQDFQITKKVDKASPKLMLGCANGDHFKSAILIARKAGKDQQEYVKYTLSEVLISSFQTSGSAGSDVVPIDQVSLNFSKIEFEYKPQKPDGSLDAPIKAGWNLKQNIKV
jgi:type VI secretion system secreted protein Hcp